MGYATVRYPAIMAAANAAGAVAFAAIGWWFTASIYVLCSVVWMILLKRSRELRRAEQRARLAAAYMSLASEGFRTIQRPGRAIHVSIPVDTQEVDRAAFERAYRAALEMGRASAGSPGEEITTIAPEHNYADMGGGALVSEILGTIDDALDDSTEATRMDVTRFGGDPEYVDLESRDE